MSEGVIERPEISRIFYRCVDWNNIKGLFRVLRIVASFTDAWIETGISINDFRNVKSHLLQMRGLKPRLWGNLQCVYSVASFTDAWIETCPASLIVLVSCRIFYRCVDWNRNLGFKEIDMLVSHLLQMRGLKLPVRLLNSLLIVASFTDAWIETFWLYRSITYLSVASFTDAWIET